MARKDLLKGLMAAPSTPEEARAPLPRSDRGAIGAVSKSISELKSRAIIEVPAEMIDNAGLDDRLDDDPQGIEDLAASIRDYGQQVPVLLRHSPRIEGRYDVVFGRRRVVAMRRLGVPVKAMVRDLNDRDMIMAQGQENSARKDLSFIEKANFAKQMTAAGYDRKLVCDALSIDKTVISRMLSVMDALPEKLIRAIGAAPSAGRDRWLALARKARGRSVPELVAAARGANSDARFAAVFAAISAPPAAQKAQILQADDGAVLGQVRRSKTRTVIELEAGGRDFADWLVDNLSEVHRAWLQGRA
ncbi:plasmid partitioning protein RepB [Paracoccus benzoatiresistens]|uniref:Plasmid partitioning protein RepB n=1 Tax=Paracoccus benzoatiresistens TaxID=2997341 RepID=A0ABT4J1V0_9RHOB|nr:plasmid partitioning protein RepB [Paracoccus sp. EF6]MCZ0961090.1 plasmid partitioning protein RepB [Paracoccus sp. EF6]